MAVTLTIPMNKHNRVTCLHRCLCRSSKKVIRDNWQILWTRRKRILRNHISSKTPTCCRYQSVLKVTRESETVPFQTMIAKCLHPRTRNYTHLNRVVLSQKYRWWWVWFKFQFVERDTFHCSSQICFLLWHCQRQKRSRNMVPIQVWMTNWEAVRIHDRFQIRKEMYAFVFELFVVSHQWFCFLYFVFFKGQSHIIWRHHTIRRSQSFVETKKNQNEKEKADERVQDGKARDGYKK